MDFALASDFIELDNLLKNLNIAPSGGAAKVLIRGGEVRVNNAVETRVRRKLRAGDIVNFGSEEIRIVQQGGKV